MKAKLLITNGRFVIRIFGKDSFPIAIGIDGVIKNPNLLENELNYGLDCSEHDACRQRKEVARAFYFLPAVLRIIKQIEESVIKSNSKE